MPKNQPLIDVAHLTKKFGDVSAVEDVSLQVNKGELVGFMGPNGAGKSTTMRLLAGFMKPTSGSIHINGVDVVKNPGDAQMHLGYLPEQGGIYSDLTVAEYLDFIARAYHVADKEKALATATNMTRCHTFLHRNMAGLSKGMRQRVFFAAAIVQDPPVLILDEPTDGLDPNQKHEMRLMLKQLAKHKAVLLSTHILEEAEAVCDRVLVIAKGRLVADSTPKELAKQGKGDIQIAFRVLTTNRGDA